MENLFGKIAGGILGAVTFIGGLFGITDAKPIVEEPTFGVALPQAVAVFETSLASPITSNATTMTLTANEIRGGGSLSGYNCFTIDEGSAQAEVVCGTVSSTTVSSLQRGLSYANGTTTVATNQFSHRRGANVKITDFPIIQLLKAQNNGEETFDNVLKYSSSISTTTIGLSDSNIASVGYANSLAFGNVPAATESTNGFVKMSVAPAVLGSPISVGDNDPRITDTPTAFASTTTGTSDATKGIVLNADGNLSFSTLKYYGDGSDGDVTISATTTLTRDMYYNNLTVNSVLITDGYKIFVKNTISGNGTVDWGTANSGGTGANGNASAAGGSAGAQSGSGMLKNTPGVVGGAYDASGIIGTTTVSMIGNNGSAGGANGTGSTGAALSGGAIGATSSPRIKLGTNIPFNMVFIDINQSGQNTLMTAAGGSGSGAGGKHATGAGSGSDFASGGGGSGASGGIVFIAARVWSGTFTIKAVGGNGGNGGTFVGSWTNGINGPGGGAGGSGGTSVVFYDLKTWTGSYNLAGGAGGTGGIGLAPGTTGATGSSGKTGISYEIR